MSQSQPAQAGGPIKVGGPNGRIVIVSPLTNATVPRIYTVSVDYDISASGSFCVLFGPDYRGTTCTLGDLTQNWIVVAPSLTGPGSGSLDFVVTENADHAPATFKVALATNQLVLVDSDAVTLTKIGSTARIVADPPPDFALLTSTVPAAAVPTQELTPRRKYHQENDDNGDTDFVLAGKFPGGVSNPTLTAALYRHPKMKNPLGNPVVDISNPPNWTVTITKADLRKHGPEIVKLTLTAGGQTEETHLAIKSKKK